MNWEIKSNWGSGGTVSSIGSVGDQGDKAFDKIIIFSLKLV